MPGHEPVPRPHFAVEHLAFHPDHPAAGPSRWLLVRGGEVFCDGSGSPILPALPDGTDPSDAIPLGTLDGIPFYALGTDAVPPGLTPQGLRDLFCRVDEESLAIAGRAVQLVHFDETTRFCGRCGEPAVRKEGEVAKVCPRCGGVVYPALTPAVIVLVRRGREILFVRSPRFPPGRYSLVAGFVEPGETLEHAAAREVAEETGVSIKNLRYFGSQPWPFPHSLMAGFFAEYAGGEVRPDGAEVEEAGWFSPDDLPDLPGRMSVAWALIRRHLGDDDPPE
ncbi:NAD(+) diphosphatase [Methanofollis aquaemaris]|uniref:NAD(+) diphosphatase n=1 Tax=Methanofollis aquaemaris TaxID=126734 RepID=A0A8A3S591_9EURY|nr:NAD(+) diphosphatase [Methanofollis aquaemaris]QSZ67029.1 NAD(+) diphosphatase [Methanofollis aquaemaris]